MIISCIKAVAEAITVFNECVTFSQWVRSLGSLSIGREKEELKEDDVLKLQSSFQCLRDTLPAMYNFIDRVEWRSHEKGVAELLPELKAAVYDAEDLLEDFRCYKQKVKIEGSATSAEPGTKFFQDFIQGNFNSKLTAIKNRLDNQSMVLERMGIHQATLRFDRSVRPETTSFPTEAKIFGRDEEIKRLIKLLGVPENNTRGPYTRKRSRSDNTKATITSVPVLPIVGIGGVGKTTLAQNFCSHPQVKKHFDVRVWICVSDDFDVKRLTKEVVEQFSGKAPKKDNLNCLQDDLADSLNKRRFLVVLDDMWDDNGELWKTFYAPFKHVFQGSMMLVTTRSQKVADIVRTTNPFLLEGLKDDVFRNFFKLCVFGSNSSNNDPELERIGEQILPKLKGSPLAAKTLGRMLGRSLDLEHWNMILYSQLWELTQEETDILPALRLSYMYLPFHLKRCFSFCAVYPKDYNFVKEELAEIWVAEGFVEPQCNISLQQTSCEYFEELAQLSFFQKLHEKYVIHDLIHDMAQLVSKDECFIIKETKDLERIPKNVRHLSVLKSRDVKWSDLESLCNQTKLRTLLCNMSLKGKKGNSVMEKWCTSTELLCMRVMVCDSISMPDSISNMKNLRYLKILDNCHFNSFPATFCRLYNLQLLYARECRFKEVPRDFSNLSNLHKFEAKFLKIDAGLLNNFNLITGELSICNLCEINKDQAAKFELINKEGIFSLTLNWSNGISHLPGSPEHNEVQVFEALHPPTSIQSVDLECYPGEYLPSWFHGSDDPTIFSSLTNIRVIDSPRLSSLEKFLQPTYMPAIKKIHIENCTGLEFVPVEMFGGLPSLEELNVWNCPKINSQRLMAPSLKTLFLRDSGNLGDDIDCHSLTTFRLSSHQLASLTLNRENFPLLSFLKIQSCRMLETLIGGWPILKSLYISGCPRLKWENRMVLPSSLQKLQLCDCGYFSVRYLENLTSLKSLEMLTCNHIEYIPRDLWSSNLKSLQELKIWDCEELVSIGGPEAIAHIPIVLIQDCPKLMEVRQPLQTGFQW
ncbi:putative disease resistance protein RGA3 [Miscanthus floridulus]|uniref:putative disease resistance protein RGA3 n=1 Tax=Miscanthus floridulus TaxID=154761 RepID=UPI003458B80E